MFVDWILTFGLRSNSKFSLHLFTFEKLEWTESNSQGLTLNKKLFKPKCQNEKNIIQNITQNQRGKKMLFLI